MKILFVWTGLTSYMADCWRRLADVPGVELRVIVDDSSVAARAVSFKADEVMRGLAYELNGTRLLDGWRPDAIFAVGWHSAVCRAVVCDGRFDGVPKVCCFDMPWRWKPRCLLAPLALGRFLRRYDAAFVPGAVCARYARWLGFGKVCQGLFAIDTERFSGAEARGRGDFFLYVGRNSREKRLDDIRRAHAIYRARGGTLELRMCGKGLEGGFVKPEEIPGLMRGAAALVLASDFDPWPLVLLEAMAAGCPVIASDRCTNRPELGGNWRVFRCGDVKALAREFLDAEARGRGEEFDRCVRENRTLARQYDCSVWVERVKTIVKELTWGES